METRRRQVNPGLELLQEKETQAMDQCQGLPGVLAAAKLLSATLVPLRFFHHSL